MKKASLFLLGLMAITYTACRHRRVDLPALPCPLDAGGRQMNAFSPNGDGRNDRYRILADSAHPITSMELHIFNGAEEEVATVWGAGGSWDGTDARTGKPCTPGRYRVEFGVITAGHGPYSIAADGETYVYLLGTAAGGCLMGGGCPESSYVFEDQFDSVTGARSYTTGERFCR